MRSHAEGSSAALNRSWRPGRARCRGDVLAVARIAGIAAAKRTADLLPLAHVIGVHAVEVNLTVVDLGVAVSATVRTADRTGVEMEALTAVSVAALAVIDLVKGIDKRVEIEHIALVANLAAVRVTGTAEHLAPIASLLFSG